MGPLALAGVALYVVIAAWQGNAAQLGAALKADAFDNEETGQIGFLKWAVAFAVLWFAAEQFSWGRWLLAFAFAGLAIEVGRNNPDGLASVTSIFSKPWNLNTASTAAGDIGAAVTAGPNSQAFQQWLDQLTTGQLGKTDAAGSSPQN